jgi:sugar phosphate isomerase/epimerase
MKIEQVALQLYTLRDQLKTPADIAASLKKVRAVGYQAVQASGLGPISEPDLLSILDGEGLKLCATHEPAVRIVNEPEKVVERLQMLGCKYTAYPHPAGVDIGDMAQVARLAKQLDHAGEILYNAGQVLAYHNHAFELMRSGDRTVLDYLYEETDARFLQGEIDTYWIQYGGGDPVEWCQKLDGRLPLLHLKDYRFTMKNQPEFAEIGYGNLNWKRIIAAAEESGCQWFIVEQDTCPGDPYDSVKKSFDYIEQHLCASPVG